MKEILRGFLGGFLAFLMLASVLYAADNYFWSLYVRTKSTHQTTAPAYFRDTGIYIYSSTDGQLDLIADGGVAVGTGTPVLKMEHSAANGDLWFITAADTFVIDSVRTK